MLVYGFACLFCEHIYIYIYANVGTYLLHKHDNFRCDKCASVARDGYEFEDFCLAQFHRRLRLEQGVHVK